ncbi:FecR family protein [Pedobacter sp.]|jgi:transmembrane sensor|uniref:FecR family protein n=1 Tax=Pedobacter sp. TaxID=1411316 RepID=UPI002C1C9B1F|nr:FecR domain-containing protein [Pedobacter sp.]HWW39867.1 FecR domain-containing protein [Pedobacter sp.]
MDQKKVSDFIKKFAVNAHTDSEHREFISWLNVASPADIEKTMDLYAEYVTEDQSTELPSPAFVRTLECRLDNTEFIHKKLGKQKWSWIAAAAVLVIIGIVAVFQYSGSKQEDQISFVKDLAPGGNKAILTLGDGSAIPLSASGKGQLALESGVVIEKTEDGQIIYKVKYQTLNGNTTQKTVYNTIATPKGGQFQVSLPDGTRVWLNAASSLKYPVQFVAEERRVQLTGEAYFEVARNKKKPFIVESKQQYVEVLGTHFNINSYEEAAVTKTTLFEGSVRVAGLSPTGRKAATLKPGQQSVLNNDHIEITENNTDAVLAWQKGLFSFTDADLKTIMNDFARWYNVEVVYVGKLPDQHFTGEISRKVSASVFLKILSNFHVKFNMNGDGKSLGKVIISSQ